MMRLFFLIMLFSNFHFVVAQQNYLLVGTYDSPKSEGIYVYNFDSETGKAIQKSYVKTPNPSFLAVTDDEKYVFAVAEIAPKTGKGGDVAAFRFDKLTGNLNFINKQLSGGDHPCHVETDVSGKWIFVSNYISGSVSGLPVFAQGQLGIATTTIQHQGTGLNNERQSGPHAHGAIISPDNKHLYVTDLGIDKLMIYDFNSLTGKLSPAKQEFMQAEPGSGPRLFTFHPSHKYAYVVEELSGTVVGYRYNKGKLKRIQRISNMPAGSTVYPGSADIHVSPDGNFLYASNRGNSNTIAIYNVNKSNGKLTLITHQSTLGKTPRNFSLDPSGHFLLVGNQDSDEIVIFRRNSSTGMLTDSGNRIAVGKPVCLKWIGMNQGNDITD